MTQARVLITTEEEYRMDNGWHEPTNVARDDRRGSQVTDDLAEVTSGLKAIDDNVSCCNELSPLQEGMLFHHMMNQNRDCLKISVLFSADSYEDVGALARAVQVVVDRHDALRTAILWQGMPRPVQVTYNTAEVQVKEEYFATSEAALKHLCDLMRPRQRDVDLMRAPLVWLHIAGCIEEGNLYALLQVHHLVCDFASIRTVVDEVMVVLDGEAKRLPAPADYSKQMHAFAGGSSAATSEQFFRSKLGDFHDPSIPFNVLDSQVDAGRSAEVRERISPSLATEIRNYATQSGVSAARLFHAAWAMVIAKTSGKDDVVFGTLLARPRSSSRYEPTFGMFVNTLPLRLRLRNVSAKEFIRQTHQELSELLPH